MKKKVVLKHDKYRSKRGGYSRLLALYCRSCNAPLMKYQKDGPGNLRRLYIDRIIEPRQKVTTSKLTCQKCKEVLGTPYMYKKEKRKSIRLYQDAVVKKMISI